jgi:hypothetical protein
MGPIRQPPSLWGAANHRFNTSSTHTGAAKTSTRAYWAPDWTTNVQGGGWANKKKGRGANGCKCINTTSRGPQIPVPTNLKSRERVGGRTTSRAPQPDVSGSTHASNRDRLAKTVKKTRPVLEQPAANRSQSISIAPNLPPTAHATQRTRQAWDDVEGSVLSRCP